MIEWTGSRAYDSDRMCHVGKSISARVAQEAADARGEPPPWRLVSKRWLRQWSATKRRPTRSSSRTTTSPADFKLGSPASTSSGRDQAHATLHPG